MSTVQQRKRMRDMEEEARREKKLAETNRKQREIQERLRALHNNYVTEVAPSESGHGLSGMDEYEGVAGY